MTRASANTDLHIIRPCWAEVDLSALRHNWQTFRRHLPTNVSILAVVKADAYGHGLLPISRALADLGAAYLGVSSIEEGIALRQGGLTLPVLILGSLFPVENVPLVFEHHLTPTVASLAAAQALSTQAERLGVKLPVHVEIDTGMGRTGVSTARALETLEAVAALGSLALEGLYTHFSSSDVDPAFTHVQAQAFSSVVQAAQAKGIKPRWIHMANSAATVRFADTLGTLVRPGLSLYGLPAYAGMEESVALKPVLAWKTRVIFLKNVATGTPVSYARTWTAARASRLATLAVGYADGLPRLLSNRGEVLIRGRRAPIVGRVTMDMTMVDVTDIPDVAVGDEVVLIGQQEGATLSAADLAGWAQTNAYEILCGLGPRVKRCYAGAEPHG